SGLRQGAYDRASGQTDLEVVMAEALGSLQHKIRSACEHVLIGCLVTQRRLGLRIPPWLVGHAADSETGILDLVPGRLQGSRPGDECESVREAVTDFQIGRVGGKTSRR